MSRLLNFSLVVLGIALVPATLSAFDGAEPVTAEPVVSEDVVIEPEVIEPDAVEPAEADLEEPFADGMMPPNWTHSGCISLNGQCYDVYSDGEGSLWVCKACGTTRNPGPNKCRKLTQWELQNARWCS